VDEKLARDAKKFGGKPDAGALFLQRLDLRDLWKTMASSPGKISALPSYHTASGTFLQILKPLNHTDCFFFRGWGCNA
jgi:hypothetical protein